MDTDKVDHDGRSAKTWAEKKAEARHFFRPYEIAERRRRREANGCHLRLETDQEAA